MVCRSIGRSVYRRRWSQEPLWLAQLTMSVNDDLHGEPPEFAACFVSMDGSPSHEPEGIHP